MVLIMSELKEIYNKDSIGQLNEEILILEQSIEDTTWAQADAYLKAKELFGLKEFAKVTHRGNKLGTMKVYANVAESYPSVNRFTTVSFKHHMVAMNNDSRYEWLKKAQDNAWSAERLRREMNPPKSIEKKAVKETLPAPEPNPLAEVRFEPEIVEKPKDVLQQMVNALNWYLANDRRSLELAASDALLFMCLLLGEDKRRIVLDELKGEYVIV